MTMSGYTGTLSILGASYTEKLQYFFINFKGYDNQLNHHRNR